MLVHLRAQHSILVGAVHRHLEKRVRAALGPTASRVRSVTAEFSDINGPRGGVDKSCRIKVVLSGLPSVYVENQAQAVGRAFDGALADAERAVRKAIARRRTKSTSRAG